MELMVWLVWSVYQILVSQYCIVYGANGLVSLECVSAGSPDPSIIWRREDGKLMNINKNESGESP